SSPLSAAPPSLQPLPDAHASVHPNDPDADLVHATANLALRIDGQTFPINSCGQSLEIDLLRTGEAGIAARQVSCPELLVLRALLLQMCVETAHLRVGAILVLRFDCRLMIVKCIPRVRYKRLFDLVGYHIEIDVSRVRVPISAG